MFDWEQLFYDSDRLAAEVSLLGSAFAGHLRIGEIEACAQIHRSHGVATATQPLGAFAAYQQGNPNPLALRGMAAVPARCRLTGRLFFWALNRRLPALDHAQVDKDKDKRIQFLQRLALLLHRQRARRPDLLYQVLMREPNGYLFKSAPKQSIRPGQWYSTSEIFSLYLQVAWVQSRYQDMWLGFQRGHLDGRSFPFSDHDIRGFSIIGEAERCLQLFHSSVITPGFSVWKS